ncbi:Forkhead-associated (FHA) domain [Trinorchestia longiramus]|nr:Forkhead-associated (FHA) domain [Trinorchestia longiramus]
MDETQLLLCTQALGDCDDSDKETFVNGWLEVAGLKYDLLLGQNTIGRNPDTCQVLLQNSAGVSKEHAVLEVEEGCSTLMDLASRNKTRMGKLVLRPHIRYALRGGEQLRFGNVSAIYKTVDSDISGEESEDQALKKKRRDVTLCPSSQPTSSLPTSSLPTSSLPTSSLPTSSLPTSSLPTSSLPTSSLASTPSVSLSPGPVEDTVSCNARLQENGRAQIGQSEACITEECHYSSIQKESKGSSLDQSKSQGSPLKNTDSSCDISEMHSTASKTSLEALNADNFSPSTPVLELKRSNSCSPFRKDSQDRKYARKCFFMPSSANTVVKESDEEVQSDDSREDDDFDDSIISPTPHPMCSATLLTKPAGHSRLTANSLLSTPVTSSKLRDKLSAVPETPCTPTDAGPAALGNPSTSRVSDPQSTEKPLGNISSLMGSRLDVDQADCYNSDVSTDIEDELDNAKEVDVPVEPNRESSTKGVNKKCVSVKDVSEEINGVTGDIHEELTQAFSGETCLVSRQDDVSIANDALASTQDILEAFGETAADSSETSINVADDTRDILSAFEESTLSPGKISDDAFKKPLTTPASRKKIAINSRERSVDDSALTQDVLDLFECPTQVVTGKLPRPSLGACDEEDDLSMAPTQPYVYDANDVAEEPTQVVEHDAADSDSDMCTQVYGEDAEWNISQKPGMMTPVARCRVFGKTSDDSKSPTFKTPKLTEMESPSLLPTQVYNENLNSPHHVLDESISDMVTQPYHSDSDVNKTDSSLSCADHNAELSISEMATQPFAADQADGAPQSDSEFSSNFAKAESGHVKENNDNLSEMVTQPYLADHPSNTSESRPEVAYGVSVKFVDGKLCDESLSEKATQPYFESVPAESISEKSKNKYEMSTRTEFCADIQESVSNMPTQPYVDRDVDHNEPTDVDATQLFDSSGSGDFSKTIVEVKDDNLTLKDINEADYDAPTQDMLNSKNEAFPLGTEDFDAPTQILPSDDEQDQESTGNVIDPQEISAGNDGTITPTLEVPLLPENPHGVLNNAARNADDEANGSQTPAKLPEKNGISLTPLLNPVVPTINMDNIIIDSQPGNHEFNEDLNTDNSNSSTVSDTMLINMPEEIDDAENHNFNPDGTLITKSASQQSENVTSSPSFTTLNDGGTSMPNGTLATDFKIPTSAECSSQVVPTSVQYENIPDTKTRSPDAKTRSPDTKTRSPDAKTRSPDAKTRSPDAKTNINSAIVLWQPTAATSTENFTPVNSFQFGSNQYNVGDLDIDENTSDESIETLNFVSDTESGGHYSQGSTPRKDRARPAVSTPRSSAKAPVTDVKTPTMVSEDESAFPRRSKRAPRQLTLRKKKKCPRKLEDFSLTSSDDDGEFDASQALFSMSVNKMTGLNFIDGISDHSSPLAPVPKTPGSSTFHHTELDGRKQSSCTADGIGPLTTEPQCSSVPSGQTGVVSVKSGSGLAIASAVIVSSDSDDETLKTYKNIEKSAKIARQATRISKRKCPDTVVETRVKSLRNKTELNNEISGVAVDKTVVYPGRPGKGISACRRLEHASSGPSGSSGLVGLCTANAENSVEIVSTSEISSVQEQANDPSNSGRVSTDTKEKKVAMTSVRSTRSTRARRRPTRYSSDQKDSDDDSPGVGQEKSRQDLRSTRAAQKRGRFLKGSDKRVKNSNETTSPSRTETETNSSAPKKIIHAIEESVETNVPTENSSSISSVFSKLMTESVSSSTKALTMCGLQSAIEMRGPSEISVNIKVNSEATVSSTTDTLINSGGRNCQHKNRTSIETSTPSRSLHPSRSTRSRASLSVAPKEVKTQPRRSTTAHSSSDTLSTVKDCNGNAQQSAVSPSDLSIIDEVETEITFRKPELHRKSTRFSSRNSSRNSTLKREAVVENNSSEQETGAPSTRNKRIKIEQSSLPSSSAPSTTDNQSSVAKSSSISISVNGGPRRSIRKTQDSFLTVHTQNSPPVSAAVNISTSKTRICEENCTSSQAQNSELSSSVRLNTTAKKNLRLSQAPRSVQPSQESLRSSSTASAGECSSSHRQTRATADEIQSSSKPPRGRGRLRNPRVQKAPADSEDLNCSIQSVESFASSVGRRHVRGTTSQRSSTASETGRSLADARLEFSLLLSPSERQSKANTKPRVLFTGIVPQPEDLKTLKKLGGVVVESATQCSVLVSASAKRTCKLLACVARGVPVVSPAWLSVSSAAAAFTDPWEYIVKDTEMEKKYSFDLRQSLLKARGRRLFAGLSIHATPCVLPQPDDMRDLVVSGGGEYLERQPRSFYESIVVVSCLQDKKLWPTFRKLNIPIVSTEFILSGILRSEVSIDSNLL